MNHKKELRATLSRTRSTISMIEVMELSARVAERVLALPEYIHARRVMCYWSIQTEVSTRGLIRQILKSGRALYLPRICGPKAMEAVRLTDTAQLRRGPMSIDEPMGDEIATADQMDLIMLPGIAFDRGGARMGHGAGYYDRFLVGADGVLKVGLTFELQIVDHLPVESHDVLMDKIISERAVYDCARYRARRPV